MKVLIVPPEEFVPRAYPLSAIFQYHQACALRGAGLEVMVVSVTPSIAVKPVCISLVRKVCGLQTFYNPVWGKGVIGIVRTLLTSVFAAAECKEELLEGLSLVRVRLPCWSDITPEEGLAYYERCVRSGYRVLTARHGKPDVVHVHNAWLAGTALMPLAREEGLPYCLTEHSTYFARDLIPARFYPQLRKVYAASALNMTVSPSLGELLEARGLLTGGYRVLPNVLDPRFEQAPPAPLPGGRPIVLLTVGELTAKKGHAVLLQAFARAFAGHPDVRLTIVGDGDLRDELPRTAEACGVAGQVTFAGRLDREAVLESMRTCHLFVLPSIVETFGVVVIEALACGRPVVCTICGGPEDIVQEGDGVLVKADDAEALADAMSEMVAGLSRYSPDSIRARAIARYGSAGFLSAMTEVYSSITGKPVVCNGAQALS